MADGTNATTLIRDGINIPFIAARYRRIALTALILIGILTLILSLTPQSSTSQILRNSPAIEIASNVSYGNVMLNNKRQRGLLMPLAISGEWICVD